MIYKNTTQMTSAELLEKTRLLWNQLDAGYTEVDTPNHIDWSEIQQAIVKTDQALNTLKAWTAKHYFDDWGTEITFFKKWKPLFLSRFIYLTHKYDFLTSYETFTLKAKRKVVNSHLRKIESFLKKNHKFRKYLSNNHAFRDKDYFLRNRFEILHRKPPFFHNLDATFTTSKDVLVAQLIAYEKLLIFYRLQKGKYKTNTIKGGSTLTWSSSKASLTELIFALHHSHCINGGNIELAVIVRHFENLFNTTIGNYHKTLAEIKLRKSDPTKFIGILKHNLSTYIDESHR